MGKQIRESGHHTDCEICGGDCSAANPPVVNCPSQIRTVGKEDDISRCPKCGAGPLGNCGFYGCETPRNTCPLDRKPPGTPLPAQSNSISTN